VGPSTFYLNCIILVRASGGEMGWGDGPVHAPVHESARNGSARSIFGCKENRSTVGPDQSKVRDGPRSGYGPVRSTVTIRYGTNWTGWSLILCNSDLTSERPIYIHRKYIFSVIPDEWLPSSMFSASAASTEVGMVCQMRNLKQK
jgi:hypothetical protein